MYLSISNITRTKPIATSEDLGEFELTFEPVNDTLIKVEGDKAVIGYIAHDTDCENPMTSCDCTGEFIVGDAALSHLGLESTSYRGDIFRDLECDGVYEKAVALLKERLILDQDFLDYCDENFGRVADDDTEDMAFMESCIEQIDWGTYGDVIPLWLESSWTSAQNDAWDQLYDQGKIGTYLAVPCRWHESVHGPGTAEAYPCSIEDCNAVWIPTQGDLENIKSQCWPMDAKIEWRGTLGSDKAPLHSVVVLNGEVVFDTPKWQDAQKYIDEHFSKPTHQDLYNAAVKYAKGCLDEYVKWCNGETYGIGVETYTREDSESDWNLVESDHCWGFIGSEYAEEEVKGLFESTCNNYLKEEVQ